jgi:hypothetical protein
MEMVRKPKFDHLQCDDEMNCFMRLSEKTLDWLEYPSLLLKKSIDFSGVCKKYPNFICRNFVLSLDKRIVFLSFSFNPEEGKSKGKSMQGVLKYDPFSWDDSMNSVHTISEFYEPIRMICTHDSLLCIAKADDTPIGQQRKNWC